MLRSLEKRAPSLYIGPKPKVKKNGGIRYVYDTKAPLKPLLKKINTTFFKQVYFPPYLTGSLAGNDFITNAAIHKGAKQAFTEDITKFFDNITSHHVYRIWHDFFGFSDEVASLLTNLTTREGRVFQGTPTSSYLANLAFWDREPALVERLSQKGIRYSRYVDDLTMSSTDALSAEDKTWLISQVYGMIGAAGFKPQRAKHDSLPASRPIKIMGLNANSKSQPSLPKKERANIQAQVYQIERRQASGESGPELRSAIAQAIGRVSKMKRLHGREAEPLSARLRKVSELLSSTLLVTQSVVSGATNPAPSDEPPF